jgi:hypothetical protein
MFRPVIQPSAGRYCVVVLTHVTTVSCIGVFRDMNDPADGRITGRNMMVQVLKHKDTAYNFIVDTFYVSN